MAFVDWWLYCLADWGIDDWWCILFYVRVRKKASAAECLVNYLQISILAVPQINDTSICSFSLMSLIFTIVNDNTFKIQSLFINLLYVCLHNIVIQIINFSKLFNLNFYCYKLNWIAIKKETNQICRLNKIFTHRWQLKWKELKWVHSKVYWIRSRCYINTVNPENTTKSTTTKSLQI